MGAANAEFQIKKRDYFSKSELEINKGLCRITDWNPKAILDRAATLVKPALEIWSFDNPSRV